MRELFREALVPKQCAISSYHKIYIFLSFGFFFFLCKVHVLVRMKEKISSFLKMRVVFALSFWFSFLLCAASCISSKVWIIVSSIVFRTSTISFFLFVWLFYRNTMTLWMREVYSSFLCPHLSAEISSACRSYTSILFNYGINERWAVAFESYRSRCRLHTTLWHFYYLSVL